VLEGEESLGRKERGQKKRGWGLCAISRWVNLGVGEKAGERRRRGGGGKAKRVVKTNEGRERGARGGVRGGDDKPAIKMGAGKITVGLAPFHKQP